MRVLLAALCFLGVAGPLSAQDPPAPHSQQEFFDGLGDLADGMRQLLEGFRSDVAPLMEDMQERLKGLGEYYPPEVLPNGDIIIRRKPDQEENDGAPTPTSPDVEGGIDI